jgi:hypothetical protein
MVDQFRSSSMPAERLLVWAAANFRNPSRAPNRAVKLFGCFRAVRAACHRRLRWHAAALSVRW